jgi:hypothetical protein
VTRPPAAELLETEGAVLTRTDLLELGVPPGGVDAIFRELPIVKIPGYRRPLIRRDAYLELLERCTYSGRDRVRPT